MMMAMKIDMKSGTRLGNCVAYLRVAYQHHHAFLR
jgi:hypothetical protein